MVDKSSLVGHGKKGAKEKVEHAFRTDFSEHIYALALFQCNET